MVRTAVLFGWLRNAVLAAFVVAICAGIFLPVYTDEVGWRFQERAGIDGVDKLFSDLCGPNTLAVPPFFMMPVRYYSAFFNTAFADPFYVRLSGVGYALLWVVMLLVLIRRLAVDRADRLVVTTIGFGLMCLGTLPLLLVWSRPEQPLILATTAALLLAWTGESDRDGQVSARTAWKRSMAVGALGVIVFSYHLKGFFLTPVFLACLFFASRGRVANLPRILVAVLLVGLAGWSVEYWVHRLQCPDDPVLAAEFARNNMGAALSASRDFGQLAAALGKIAGNINLSAYFGLPVPHPKPLSNWLAPGQIDRSTSYLWFRALIVMWWGVLILAAIGLGARARVAWQERRLDARLVLAVLLLGTALSWSSTQSIRNDYEAIFVLPLIMLVVVLALSARGPGGIIATWANVLATIVGLSAIASVFAVASIYAPTIARANTETGYIRGQLNSLPVFGYASVKPQIVAAAAKCGIREPASARALMIDDLTYFTFMHSKLPQHRLGVLANWRGSIDDPVAYLRGRGSSGAIVGCHLLPEDLRRRAKREGAFCCLGPPNW